MMSEPQWPFAGTYPGDSSFWVDAASADQYPLRYGDVFRTPAGQSLTDSKGRPWVAVMSLHPSCELGRKASPVGVQVVRVFRLGNVSQGQREEVRVGYVERYGETRIARVNMVYLAPVPGAKLEKLDVEMYADLRQTARVPLDELKVAGRVAAMTHEARVALLARDLYFRYRWPVEVASVFELERGRINSDQDFLGPKPKWAP